MIDNGLKGHAIPKETRESVHGSSVIFTAKNKFKNIPIVSTNQKEVDFIFGPM